MTLHEKIATVRKNNGLTQEELASMTKLTVRTIQRIENGESVPRSFTLKAIATALNKPFDYFIDNTPAKDQVSSDQVASRSDTIHFLQLFNLSCFAYIGIPYVHFLIPSYLLKKKKGLNQRTIDFCRRIIRKQIYWVIALNLLMLLTLAYNMVQVSFFSKHLVVNYLWPFFIMYFLNAVQIILTAIRIGKQDTAVKLQLTDSQ